MLVLNLVPYLHQANCGDALVWLNHLPDAGHCHHDTLPNLTGLQLLQQATLTALL